MKLYIAGPMTGYPENNFPAFREAAKALRAIRPDVTFISPHEINIEAAGEVGTNKYLACLRADLKEAIFCDGIILLPKWHKSNGAKAELITFLNLGLEVWTYNEFVAEHLEAYVQKKAKTAKKPYEPQPRIYADD